MLFSAVRSINKDLSLTILREKLFDSVQYKNGWLAASDFFHMFTQSIKEI